MLELQRLTTEYVEAEDRIRLSGEAEEGATVVLWLTRRLLSRLAPPLCLWLEKQGGGEGGMAEILQGFAQQAAVQSLTPQPPVRAGASEAGWLVRSVDIAAGDAAVALTLNGPAGEQARLTLPVQGLRQWLSILHGQFEAAGWPTGEWPAWVEEARPKSAPASALLH